MELTYPGKQDKQLILDRAGGHEPLRIGKGRSALIKGNNFDVLGSLIAGGLSGTVDLIYIDPPFNTRQEFSVSGDRVRTVSRGVKTHVAYSDQMSTEAYLEFMRERLLLLREMLSDQGSIYLHIDNKMGHYLRLILDEIFGPSNYKNDISRIKSNPKNFMRRAYGNQKDMVLFYAKDASRNIFNNIKVDLTAADKIRMFEKVDERGRRYNTVPVHAPGVTYNGRTGGPWRDKLPPAGRHWRTDPDELERLDGAGLIEWSKNSVPRIKKYADEHTGKKIQDIWDYIDPAYPRYPTEKNLKMLEMIVEQSSNPDSVVLDCFAGSGSTLQAAGDKGRRWIGIDQSDYAIKVMKQRLTAQDYDFIDFGDVDRAV